MNANDISYEKKIFSAINWFDFVFSQEFTYKNKNLKCFYINLFVNCLNYSFEKEKDKIDTSLRDYFVTKIKTFQNNSGNTNLDSEICVKNIKRHIIWGNKTDYRYLLVSEFLYSLEICGLLFSDDIEIMLKNKLIFSEKEFQNALLLAENPFSIKNKRISKSYLLFNKFVEYINDYNALRVFNIGVCATMSAGKSSFVNALLGYDYLPMRNEVTTARITSVYDNDNARKMIGYTMKAENILSLNDCLDSKVVDEWNSDDNIDRIILQGDLDNIGNNGIIVAVHDTPGTNNSGDRNHHDITIDFFQNNKMDAILFVANAEHLCTNDEKSLLKELYDKIVSKQNIPVIFVLNKIDNLDTEKETLEEVIAHYKEFVEELGYTKTCFFPISAKAARLLKMAIKSKADSFTEAECDIFPSIVKKFTKRLNLSNGDGIQCSDNTKICIDGETYKKSELINALFHTGINRIETEIESIVKR